MALAVSTAGMAGAADADPAARADNAPAEEAGENPNEAADAKSDNAEASDDAAADEHEAAQAEAESDNTGDNGGDNDAAGDDAEITVDFECTSVEVTSTKGISNVVLVLADGTEHKVEVDEDDVHNRTFESPDGQSIEAVYVKSGNNASGDGPGYGERFDSDATSCELVDGNNETGDTGNGNTGNNETGNTGNGNTGNNGGDNDAAGDDAEITVDFECTSVEVTSTKGISNVVLVLADGTEHKVEVDEDDVHNRTFESPDGQSIEAVYVKSGNNASGDGPGYGERFDSDATSCDTTEGNTGNKTGDDDDDANVVDDDDVADGGDSEAIVDNDGGTTVSPDAETPDVTDVEGDVVVNNPTTPVPVVFPTTPVAPAESTVVMSAAGEVDRTPAVLGQSVTRTGAAATGSLARTGTDSALLLAPFGLGLLLLGYGLHRSARRPVGAHLRT